MSIQPGRVRGRSFGRFVALAGAALLLSAAASPLPAQQRTIVTGAVTAATGEPIAAASVVVEGTSRGAVTDASGRFTILDAPEGARVLTAQRIGYRAERREVTVAAAAVTRVDFALAESAVEMNGVVVSATREVRLKAETPASVGVVSGQELREARPVHPGDVAGRIPGVWVSAASGEGHMTAIRQPRTTKPMFLFLEDGIPTRSTGFFNHNALYEVNVPQADRMEILKGPATALYGSDAIGGVINVETRRPSLRPQWESSLEGGSNGWTRALLSGSTSFGDDGLRADLNLTRSDGFRDATGYERQSGTLRWDRFLPGGATLKTVATLSRVDQLDGSSISAEDFVANRTANYTPIAFRKVDAFRLSAAYERPGENSLFSVTPFFRYNRMELLPTWMLAFDPVVSSTGHRSYGALAKVRRNLPFWGAKVIGGVDVEHSPGQRREHSIQRVREGQVYTSYTRGDRVYDYDVTFRGVSPYLQAELAPTDRLRVSAGLRYDHVGYDYTDRMETPATPRHRRPESTEVRYDHLSPKLGVTYAVAPELGLFASYRHGFRAPSEGQLFRQGSSETGVGLEPVRADNYEVGVRGEVGGRVSYEASVYRMDVGNDILTLVTQTPTGPNRVNSNAGATRHEGVEVGIGVALTRELRVDASYSNALHTYREWTPGPTQDFSGKRMESAPRELINGRVGYAPSWLADARLALEWVRVGRYFTDPLNTQEYPGHDLFNARLNLPVGRSLELIGQLNNVLDERYAEGASYNPVQGAEFSPGRPRSVNLGVQYRWQR